MSVFQNMNPGMSAGEARQTTSSNSWMNVDPDDPITFYDADGNPTEIVPEAGSGGVLQHPSIAQAVSSNEKSSLLKKVDNHEISGPIRDTSGRYGAAKEWDHLALTLSRDESATLRDLGPEAEERFKEVFAAALTTLPGNPEAKRMGAIAGIHKDTGNYHIHGVFHRIAQVDAPTGRELLASYDMTRHSEWNSTVEHLNSALQDAGFDFLIVREAQKYPKSKSSFADKSTGIEHKDAEGQPLGADPGQSILQQAKAITPDAENLRKAIEREEREIAEMEAKIEKRRQETEKQKEMMSAFLKVKEVEEAAIMANRKAEIAEAAKLEAEAEAKAATEEAKAATHQAAQLTADLESVQTERDAFESKLAEANGLLGDAQDKITELSEDLDNTKADLEQANEAVTTSKRQIVEVEAERDELKESVASMTDELKAARREVRDYQQQATAANDELEAKSEFYTKRDKEHVSEITSLKAQVSDLQSQLAAAIEDAKKQVKVVRDEAKKIVDENNEKMLSSIREAKSKTNEFFNLLKGHIVAVLEWREKAGIRDAGIEKDFSAIADHVKNMDADMFMRVIDEDDHGNDHKPK